MTITDQQAIELLGKVIREKIGFSDNDLLTYYNFFSRQKIAKREQVLRAGELCKYNFFILKGCLRNYTIDAKGNEHVMQFAFEEYWISDSYSFLGEKPALYFIDALEETEVLVIDKQSYDAAFLAVPCLERYLRIAIQNAYISVQHRLLASHSETAEEKYLALKTRFPAIEQRVAQHQIASYLGITPESLSRIRRKLLNS